MRFGEWEYSPDHDATIVAYRRAKLGGADSCGCNGCRNFGAAREHVFPDAFLALLEQLGIDPRKDAEVYHCVRLGPGRHSYSGWFHFVGTLDKTGDFVHVDFGPDFKAWMCRATAPRLPTLKDKSVVQLEFDAEGVPWLLDEPELE